MLQVGIVGASGFTGAELLRICATHPDLTVAVATAETQAGRRLAAVHPALAAAYPDLKANQNFRDLQAQLEGTENRITQERKKFNEVVKTYNTKVGTFPTALYAGMFGFTPKAYFTATAGADKAPEVQF